MRPIKVSMNLKLPAKIHKKKKWYLASCPLLDVHSQGDTEEQAKRNLVDALVLFFISCFERGTLDNVLKECGFTPIISTEPDGLEPPDDFIDVPIPFHILPSKSPGNVRCRA